MGAQLELSKKRLFGENSLNVGNIKLFPGSNRDATPEAMAQEVNKAISQMEAGDYDLISSFDESIVGCGNEQL